MKSPAVLKRIVIYPLKSFDPLERPAVAVLPSGALKHDRQFALVDESHRFINGKRDRRVHGLSLRLDPETRTLTLQIRGRPDSRPFHVDQQRTELQAALSLYFGGPVQLIENQETGFPDDGEAPGPTVISTASVETVAGWFPTFTPDEVRLRFRANLEIGETEPFWEDRLFGPGRETVAFRIGTVEFVGVNPCQRCVVPSRDPHSGAELAGLAKEFSRRRRESLPSQAAADRFDHYYRLATNTRLAATGGIVRVGDAVEILSAP